jgi:hypothetical protein
MNREHNKSVHDTVVSNYMWTRFAGNHSYRIGGHS